MVMIKMLKTAMGADDGINTIAYRKDSGYDVSESLAKDFIGIGVAVLVGTAESPDDILPPVKAPEELPEGADPEIQENLGALYPPETQAHEGAPENKSEDEAEGEPSNETD